MRLSLLRLPRQGKKRRRANNFTLGSNFRDEKEALESQMKNFYSRTQRAIREETAVPLFKRALYAAKMSWAWQGYSVDIEKRKVDEFVRKHLIFCFEEDIFVRRAGTIDRLCVAIPPIWTIVVATRLSATALSSVAAWMHMAFLT
jgi:hypothetical protein